MAAKFTVLPKAPSLRELAHEVRLKEYFSYGLLPSSPDGLATAPLFAAYAASSPGAGEVVPLRGELFIESAHSKALPFGRAGIAQQ